MVKFNSWFKHSINKSVSKFPKSQTFPRSFHVLRQKLRLLFLVLSFGMMLGKVMNHPCSWHYKIPRFTKQISHPEKFPEFPATSLGDDFFGWWFFKRILWYDSAPKKPSRLPIFDCNFSLAVDISPRARSEWNNDLCYLGLLTIGFL